MYDLGFKRAIALLHAQRNFFCRTRELIAAIGSIKALRRTFRSSHREMRRRKFSQRYNRSITDLKNSRRDGIRSKRKYTLAERLSFVRLCRAHTLTRAPSSYPLLRYFNFNKWFLPPSPLSHQPLRWESRCHWAYRDYRSMQYIGACVYSVCNIAKAKEEKGGCIDERRIARASSILFARRTRGYKVRRDSIVGLIMRNAWDVCKDAFAAQMDGRGRRGRERG